MIQYKHCDLCLHSARSLKSGMTCGLTDKKPIFENTCPDIKFSNVFKENTTELLSELEVVKRKKKSVHFNFYILIGIGFLIVFGGNSLLKHTIEIESVYHFRLTILLYGLGTLLLSLAYRNLNKYRRQLKKLEVRKAEIEKVIDEYEIDFETIIKRN